MAKCATALVAGFSAMVFAASIAYGADLPKTTQQVLKDLQLGPEILTGLDDELNLPAEWLAGARKEGKLEVMGSMDPQQFEDVIRPFQERYPFIKATYNRGSFSNRAMSVLVAFRQGRVITDVMTGFGGSAMQFKQAKAFENLLAVPNVSQIAGLEMRDPEGEWVGHQMTEWCITYNTKLLKPEDLPATWDDMLSNPKWGGGHLGLGNRPQLWLFALRAAKGDAWARDFTEKLFSKLKPQLRKEGVNAVISLVALGDIHASLPASGYRTRLMADKGAPVSFYCPEPVPVSVNEIALLRGSPNPNAGRLFINWLLSKEGQVVQFAADHGSPVHKALNNDPRFLNYPETLRGKARAFRAPEDLEQYGSQVFELWNTYWGGK